ncbi:MAG: hypothetical protein ACK5Z5_07355 [Neisseriaceae bacterium]
MDSFPNIKEHSNLAGIQARFTSPDYQGDLNILNNNYNDLKQAVDKLSEAGYSEFDIISFFTGEKGLADLNPYFQFNDQDKQKNEVLKDIKKLKIVDDIIFGCFGMPNRYIKKNISAAFNKILKTTDTEKFFSYFNNKSQDKLKELFTKLKQAKEEEEEEVRQGLNKGCPENRSSAQHIGLTGQSPLGVTNSQSKIDTTDELEELREGLESALQKNADNAVEYYENEHNFYPPSYQAEFIDYGALLKEKNIFKGLVGDLWQITTNNDGEEDIKPFNSTLTYEFKGKDCVLYRTNGNVKLYKLDPENTTTVYFTRDGIFSDANNNNELELIEISDNVYLTGNLQKVTDDQQLIGILDTETEYLQTVGLDPSDTNRKNKYFDLSNQSLVEGIYKDVVKIGGDGKSTRADKTYGYNTSQAKSMSSTFSECFAIVNQSSSFTLIENGLNNNKTVLTFLAGGFQSAIQHHSILQHYPPQNNGFIIIKEKFLQLSQDYKKSYTFSEDHQQITLTTDYPVQIVDPTLSTTQKLDDVVTFTDTFELHRNPDNPTYEVQLKLVKSSVEYKKESSKITNDKDHTDFKQITSRPIPTGTKPLEEASGMPSNQKTPIGELKKISSSYNDKLNIFGSTTIEDMQNVLIRQTLPKKIPDNLKSFFDNQEEITTDNYIELLAKILDTISSSIKPILNPSRNKSEANSLTQEMRDLILWTYDNLDPAFYAQYEFTTPLPYFNFKPTDEFNKFKADVKALHEQGIVQLY